MFSKTELFHTTFSSVYVALIADALNVQNHWILLTFNTFVHYVVTVSRTLEFSWLLCGLSGSLWCLKAINELRHRKKGREAPKPAFTEEETRMVVNGFRYVVCSLVCISIFTCDFTIYPAYKMKSPEFGLSLMDFGVAAFMFNAGILCAKSHRFRWRKSCYMLLMGCIRLAVLQSGYHSDPTEYGVHLNFYFVYLLADTLSVFFRGFNSALICGLFLSLHESILARDQMVEYVFHANRTGWINANREGLLSIVPYMGVLFLGKSVGETLFRKQPCRQTGWALLRTFGYLMSAHYLGLVHLAPSRRLSNVAFSSFACAAMLFPIAIFYLMSSIYKIRVIKVLEGMSRYMGPLFLLSNGYVLIGNLIFDWKKCSPVQAHLVNGVYLALLFGLPLLFIDSGVAKLPAQVQAQGEGKGKVEGKTPSANSKRASTRASTQSGNTKRTSTSKSTATTIPPTATKQAAARTTANRTQATMAAKHD